MKFPHALAAAVLLSALVRPDSAAAVTLGQKDTFEDGTTQGWLVNLLGMGQHPAPPVNVPSGGPGGADDNYLLLSAVGGVGAGSRLTVLNLAQWTGDFVAAGIGAIAMQLNNFGSTELALRLLFEDPMGGPPNNLAFSTEAVILPAGSGWTDVVFPIAPDDLSAGLGSVLAALSGTTAMRLFHSPALGFPGPEVVAQLGVDDIEALAAVPEPTTLALWASGLLLGFAPRALRRR